MICTVKKPFLYSTDGVTPRQAVTGEKVDLPNALVPGLVKEGYIGEAKLVPPQPAPASKPAPTPIDEKASPELPNKASPALPNKAGHALPNKGVNE